MSEPLTALEREALRRRFVEADPEFEPALVGVSPDIVRSLLSDLERVERERDEARDHAARLARVAEVVKQWNAWLATVG